MAAVPTVFISHAHEDKPLARELARILDERGYAIWLDDAELVIGDSLVERISAVIAEGDLVLAIVSPDSLRSEWCQQELSWARSKHIHDRRVVVLPIRYRGLRCPRSLPTHFGRMPTHSTPKTSPN